MYAGRKCIDVKIAVEGCEEMMELIDKANSLIRELKDTVFALNEHSDIYAKMVRTSTEDTDDDTK